MVLKKKKKKKIFPAEERTCILANDEGALAAKLKCNALQITIGRSFL
jgi:hypothetical protein